MATVSYFSSAFAAHLSSLIHPALHSTSKKRKRENDGTDDDVSDKERQSTLNVHNKNVFSAQLNPSAVSSITHTEAGFSFGVVRQYHTAGQPLSKDLPGGHFPHAPYCSIENRSPGLEHSLNEELAALRSPVIAAQRQHRKGNPGNQLGAIGLKQQHVATLVTMMHRCLLDEDYVRAGRAWGMLLRTEVNGLSTDPRKTDRWGIGAEILLRHDVNSGEQPTRARQSSSDRDRDHEQSQRQSASYKSFTKQNIELAKAYYERLILQYPHRKFFPNIISALDFYPAMFGLWIYSVQKEWHDALYMIEEAWRGNDSSSRESSLERVRLWRSIAPDRRLVETRELHKNALVSGQEIAGRLDELLTSPPYSDDIKLRNLVGMVALWIGDLEEAVKSSHITTEGNQSMVLI